MHIFSGDFLKRFMPSVAATLVLLTTHSASAQTIDFESLVDGAALFGIDVNADGRTDVRFSTAADGGFNTSGPNPDDQVYATGSVLETSSLSDPDIRVDFLGGATGSIRMGFVIGGFIDDPGQGLQVEVFDQLGERLASAFQPGELLTIGNASGFSGFPENFISVSFDGVASYALLDATASGTRFVIDDFSGTFAPAAVPEPQGALGLLVTALLWRRRSER